MPKKKKLVEISFRKISERKWGLASLAFPHLDIHQRGEDVPEVPPPPLRDVGHGNVHFAVLLHDALANFLPSGRVAISAVGHTVIAICLYLLTLQHFVIVIVIYLYLLTLQPPLPPYPPPSLPWGYFCTRIFIA